MVNGPTDAVSHGLRPIAFPPSRRPPSFVVRTNQLSGGTTDPSYPGCQSDGHESEEPHQPEEGCRRGLPVRPFASARSCLTETPYLPARIPDPSADEPR